MDNLSRVLFPVISRIQHDNNKITGLIHKILHYQTLILAPSIIGLALVMNTLIVIIPKYIKWQPALPIFYLFCLASLFSSYSTPFINMFNALGKVKISFIFMAMWTILVWILTTALTNIFGYYGFPIAQLMLSATFIAVVWQAKKILRFEFLKYTHPPLVSAMLMGVIIYLINSLFAPTYITLITSIVLGIISYITILALLFKMNIFTDIKTLLKND